MTELHVRVAEELRFFLPAGHRADEMRAGHDGTASLGHVVEALGIPLTEVGGLRADGRDVPPSHRPRPDAVIEVAGVSRPQPLAAPPRFLLDVHLGALARRLRLVGVDAAYRNEAADADLVAEAGTARRVLLTRDRGLLQRRALWCGAYVYGQRPDGQLTDVLTRFDVPLAPWTRCPACNGVLEAVPKAEIADRLPPGTRRTYDSFSRCTACARLYWPGAHYTRLTALVEAARSAGR